MSVPTWLAMDDSDRLVFAAMTALTFLEQCQPGHDAIVGDPECEMGALNVNDVLRESLRPYLPQAAFVAMKGEKK